MLPPREMTQHLFVTSIGLCFSTVTLGVLWVRVRERALRAESLLEGVHMGEDRAGSTGPALDAIAEEVERIGEGQRFLTRVMSEQVGRMRGTPQSAPVRITPH